MVSSEGLLPFIRTHYQKSWGDDPTELSWHKGPTEELPVGFCILRFQPRSDRAMWTYATCGMCGDDENGLELHLFSPVADDSVVELLTVIAHYHRTGSKLGLHHTVNFGRPWLDGSASIFGFVSLPYLDGPDLEWLKLFELNIRFLWLIPITPEELQFKKTSGAEALEEAFELNRVDYVNPFRESIIP